jgi:outer membrane protein assembly factor BamB
MFIQYGGIVDAVIVGTRDPNMPNQLRLLKLADGTLLEAYSGAGSGGAAEIGPILGGPAIDYATQRVYFASYQRTGGDTLFCVEISATAPHITRRWSLPLGNIGTSPVLRNGRVYVGSVNGVVYSLDKMTGGDPRSFTTGDGAVKGFIFPDRRNDDLFFATDTKVWSVSDDGGGASGISENWQWSGAANPSIVLFRPGTTFVYVGAPNGVVYQLDFSQLPTTNPQFAKPMVLGGGAGAGQVGAPTLDIGVSPPLLIVGSEAGVLYAVEVPFP